MSSYFIDYQYRIDIICDLKQDDFEKGYDVITKLTKTALDFVQEPKNTEYFLHYDELLKELDGNYEFIEFLLQAGFSKANNGRLRFVESQSDLLRKAVKALSDRISNRHDDDENPSDNRPRFRNERCRSRKEKADIGVQTQWDDSLVNIHDALDANQHYLEEDRSTFINELQRKETRRFVFESTQNECSNDCNDILEQMIRNGVEELNCDQYHLDVDEFIAWIRKKGITMAYFNKKSGRKKQFAASVKSGFDLAMPYGQKLYDAISPLSLRRTLSNLRKEHSRTKQAFAELNKKFESRSRYIATIHHYFQEHFNTIPVVIVPYEPCYESSIHSIVAQQQQQQAQPHQRIQQHPAKEPVQNNIRVDAEHTNAVICHQTPSDVDECDQSMVLPQESQHNILQKNYYNDVNGATPTAVISNVIELKAMEEEETKEDEAIKYSLNKPKLPPHEAHQINHRNNPNKVSVTSKPLLRDDGDKNNCRFYIAENIIVRLIAVCVEVFNAENVIGLVLNYCQNSINMQVNDRQIRIFETSKGPMCIIDIDLHFKDDGESILLMATLNNVQYRDNTKWCISAVKRAADLNMYGIDGRLLPKSSRKTKWFMDGLKNAPSNCINWQHIIDHTNWRKLLKMRNITSIKEDDLKYFCHMFFDDAPILPVLYVKDRGQCVEWKKLLRILDKYGKEQWISIGLRYVEGERLRESRWKIVCLEYDVGRVYYQHRLIGVDCCDVYRKNLEILFKMNK